MVDDGIYTKNADIQALAGVNAGTTEKATAATDVYVLNVEAGIDLETGYDWSTAWTTGGILDDSLKLILTQAGAAKCAMIVASNNSGGYGEREYETLLDFLNELYDTAIRIIKEKDGAAMMRGEA